MEWLNTGHMSEVLVRFSNAHLDFLLPAFSTWLAYIVSELQEEALQRRQVPHMQVLIKPLLVMLAKISSAKASHIVKPRLKWKGTHKEFESQLYHF